MKIMTDFDFQDHGSLARCSLKSIAWNVAFQCIISYLLNAENKHLIIFKYIWIIEKREEKGKFYDMFHNRIFAVLQTGILFWDI